MEQTVLDDILITKILSFHTLHSEAGMSARRNRRHAWAIIMKYEGETEYTSKSGRWISNRNHCIILPQGSSYEWRCTEAGGYYVVEFTAESSCKDVRSFYVQNGDEIERMFVKLEQAYRMRKPGYELSAMSGVYKMLSIMAKLEEKNYNLSSKLRKIAPSIDYIHRFYDHDLSNDLVAAESQVSTVYFRKIFTECYGMSSMRYLHKLRIERAKEMLRSEYGTVGNIAKSLGYSSIQHFSKTFHEYTGMSPKQYSFLNE